MKALKNISFFGILLLLLIPLVQQQFRLVDVRPLSGAYNLPDTVALNSRNWFEAEFQEKYGPYYEYQIGFRPAFVRLRNQLYYWLYGQSTNYVVVGKGNQLFAWNYWAPFYGLDFVGEDSIRVRTERIHRLKSKLDSMGVPLLVVIGPNKVRYSAEFLPENFANKERTPNNYQAYRSALDSAGIPVVDFNAVFNEMKEEMGTAMFPNTGTHWSAYGMALCLDSILSFANQHQENVLRDIAVTNYFRKDSIVESDIDLSNDLNLIYPIRRQPNLFPEIQVNEKGRKVKLFVIGDSFYWNLYQLDAYYETVDSSSHFWYYNNTDISFSGERKPVENYDAVSLAKEADAVILLATEANLHLLPFDFPREFLHSLSTKKDNRK